nr:MAG TPA: hypothetical protein [Caudoviricetes sp.]
MNFKIYRPDYACIDGGSHRIYTCTLTGDKSLFEP